MVGNTGLYPAGFLYSVIIQTMRRDWLHSSLMLFPIPVIVGWLLAAELGAKFPELSVQRFYDLAPWMGLSFLALAAAVAAFVRLRQRWLKVVILVVSGLSTLAMVAYYAEGRLGWLFLTPALVEGRIRRRRVQRSAQMLAGS